MSITYVDGGSSANNGVSSVTVTTGSAPAADDYIIASFACDIASNTMTWPFTPTETGSASSTVDGGLIKWAGKKATGSEGTSYVMSADAAGNDIAASVVIYRGVDTTTPMDVTATSNSLGSAASPFNVTATGVATGAANRMLVWIGGVDNVILGTVTSAVPSASPATWTKRIDVSNTNWANLAVCDVVDTAGTYTTDVTAVQTNTNGGNGGRMGFLLALRAAAGGGANWIKERYWWSPPYNGS
jgi:hypothetical protein